VEYHREQEARKEDGKLEEWELLLEMIAVKETKAKPYSSPPHVTALTVTTTTTTTTTTASFRYGPLP
jgi:hypothetical protein